MVVRYVVERMQLAVGNGVSTACPFYVVRYHIDHEAHIPVMQDDRERGEIVDGVEAGI